MAMPSLIYKLLAVRWERRLSLAKRQIVCAIKLIVLSLVLIFSLAGRARVEKIGQTKCNGKICGWEKALAEVTVLEQELFSTILKDSPDVAEQTRKTLAVKINFYVLETLIKKAKKEGFLQINEEEEGDLIVGQINDIIARIKIITSGPDLTAFIVSPIGGIKVLPYDSLVPGEISNEIEIVAAQGEYEPASFVIYSRTVLNDLALKVNDLKGMQGMMPSSRIDIKVVKCWYQTGVDWNSGKFYEGSKTLVPELLLHDDTLVKVDTKKKENYLKLSFPEGEKYCWISNPAEAAKHGGPQLGGTDAKKVKEFPVKDSPVLLPVTIPAWTNKQFWVTVKVPESAKDGDYTSIVSLSSKGKQLGTITLKLRVLPFRLASPKTYYDLNQEFTSSIYYFSKLSSDYPEGTVSASNKSKEQLTAELKDIFSHGVTNPIEYQTDYRLLEEYLDIRNKVGMGKQSLYDTAFWLAGVMECDFRGLKKGFPVPPEKLASLKIRVKKVMDIFKSYGISDVYFFGQDEAKDEQVTAQRPAWKAVREAGGKIFASGYRAGVWHNKQGNFELAGDIQDLFISAGKPFKEEAAKWHSVGHKIWCYGNPQAGPENPALFRKNYGFLLWKSNYDGAATYAYMHSSSWNDFNAPGKEYCFVYPTVNGVIDTIAWEGYREAIDDIRYGTTLKLLIEKVKKSGQKAEIAREAADYLANLNVERNPELIRREIIDHILKLR